MNTGRYREGIDKLDYIRWKTYLRCALNKAPDIEYLEEESRTQEDQPDQYRVYKFKPPTSKYLPLVKTLNTSLCFTDGHLMSQPLGWVESEWVR